MSEKLTAAIEWLRKMGNTSHGIAVLDNDQRDALLAHLDGEKERQDVALAAASARIAALEADLKEADAAYTEDALRMEKAEAEKEELEVDLADSHRLRERLDTLLTSIADNLLGYDPNILHDWSRLPELIRQVREVGVTVVGEHPQTFAKNVRAEEAIARVTQLESYIVSICQEKALHGSAPSMIAEAIRLAIPALDLALFEHMEGEVTPLQKARAELEKLKVQHEELRVSAENWLRQRNLAIDREEALQKFKDFVHTRLDKAGVPVDPPGEHRDAGCRIGQRLDLVLGKEKKDGPKAS